MTNPKSQITIHNARRRGFTLVELLVVVAIIGILAALVVTAAMLAITRARSAAIRMEVGSLDAAVTSLKNQETMIAYPPDGSAGAASVEAYVNAMFPRRDVAGDAPMGIDINTGMSRPADLADIGPSEALHFWLRGFGEDPQRPLSGANRRPPVFNFDPLRLRDEDNDGWLEYAPRYCQGTPYVYFCSSTYSSASHTQHNAGIARPYLSDTPLTPFAAQPTFQIITAGQDGNFGGGGSYPSGAGYSEADNDNITSFSKGTLGDDVE